MKQAFTLAETLVTLGIIGVVAALTLPNVMNNYKKKTYVAQLQKFYNQVSNAALSYMVDQEVDTLADTDLLSDFDERGAFLKKYFRVTKDCESDRSCFAENYKYLNGSSETGYEIISSGSYIVVLNTGAVVGLTFHQSDSLRVYVDLNGKAKPNVAGRDLFLLSLGETGDLVDFSSAGCDSIYGCFNKILEDGWKMDY